MHHEQEKTRKLQAIQQAFARGRQTGELKPRFCPPRLRALAVAAIRQGCSRRDVIQAAGVSLASITNWLRDESKHRNPVPMDLMSLRPLELKVVKYRPAHESMSAENAAPALPVLASIHFRSGVRMEIPVSAISTGLVTALNGVTP